MHYGLMSKNKKVVQNYNSRNKKACLHKGFTNFDFSPYQIIFFLFPYNNNPAMLLSDVKKRGITVNISFYK
jgi:hypothetical protein